MARRRNPKKDDTLVDIVEARDNAQDFFEANQNTILMALVGAVLLIGGYLAYTYLYQAPQEQEAIEAMEQAQRQFERDSFALALQNANGDQGFLDIIDNYGGTKAGNLAQYYAGICYLHLGQTDAAIEYLEDFSPAGEVLPISRYGAMADAYGEKGDFDQALQYYDRAVQAGSNEFLTAYYLKKMGMLQEKQGDLAGSKKSYQTIKDKYPFSPDARDIDKFLARVGGDTN
ncbi:MAG: tetratricopeptide repeat protein [Bacteroidota bacterium]